MVVLGIESSAHTFGVGVVDNGRVLSNEKEMYKIGTTGMIPAKAAEFHVKNAPEVIARAMERANVGPKDITGVGYTRGPGIGPCLQVGELSAKSVADELGVKIVPVHHGVCHIEIVRALSGLKNPIVLYVSGGNSQILKRMEKPKPHYHILGETFDIGVGNMLDSFAREIKLDPAWGSSVEKTALGGDFIDLPYTVKGMDFSFTGLQTRATELAKEGKSNRDLCYSMQEVAYAMLCEATERALLLTKSTELCVAGGVAQSTKLKNMLVEVAKEHGAKFGYAGNEYNADNGAMIAFVAEMMLKKGVHSRIEDCDIEQKYRTDQMVLP